jgi:hypothetical protein
MIRAICRFNNLPYLVPESLLQKNQISATLKSSKSSLMIANGSGLVKIKTCDLDFLIELDELIFRTT